MSKVLVVLAFAGGVATGLLAAKLYVRHEAQSAVHQGLEKIGLSGGVVEDVLVNTLVPAVV